MTNSSMLTHEVAFDLYTERARASTEAAERSLNLHAINSMRSVIGATLIALGERLTGSNTMATSAGAR